MGQRRMTPDEIVAHHLDRLIDSRPDLSTKAVAERLGIGVDQARDMRRPRRGRPQRSFSWHEVVRLCVSLDVSLFEIALPPKDVAVTGHRSKAVPPDDVQGVKAALLLADRDQFARDIFGFPIGDKTPRILSVLVGMIQEERGERRARLEAEIEKAATSAREFMDAIETLERRVAEAAQIREEDRGAEEK